MGLCGLVTTIVVGAEEAEKQNPRNMPNFIPLSLPVVGFKIPILPMCDPFFPFTNFSIYRNAIVFSERLFNTDRGNKVNEKFKSRSPKGPRATEGKFFSFKGVRVTRQSLGWGGLLYSVQSCEFCHNDSIIASIDYSKFCVGKITTA